MNEVIDAHRHDDGVPRVELGDLRARSQSRPAIEHHVELVGGAVHTPFVVLPRLQADELGDNAGSIEDVYSNRPLIEEAPNLLQVNYFHAALRRWPPVLLPLFGQNRRALSP